MNTDQTQQVTISFNTDSEAEASTLAAELQDQLRAENIPVERRRQDPNALDMGEILALAMEPASHLGITMMAAVIAHTVVEFALRWKTEVVIERLDGTKFVVKGMSLQQLAPALEEFLNLSFSKSAALPASSEENNSEDHQPIP
jgi:hypothetical protein